MRVNNTKDDSVFAVIIFVRSLREKYLHDILYTPRQPNMTKFTSTKKGKTCTNINLYATGIENSKRMEKDKKREKVIISMSEHKKKRRRLNLAGLKTNIL